MAINAQGNELENFACTGTFKYGTGATSAYRASYQRGAPYLYAAGSGSKWEITLASAKTTQSFSARFGGQSNGQAKSWNGATSPLFVITDGGVPILGVWSTVTSGYLTLLRYNGSTWDTLDTGDQPTPGQPIRLDMYVESYGASGRVRVWLSEVAGFSPPVLWLDSGTMDITTSGSTSFDGILLSCVDPANAASSDANSIAEFVCADEPTNRLSLCTLYPNAAGDTNTWDVGTYTAVDERDADTSDFTESGTATQLFLCNVTDIPTGLFTPMNVQVTVLAAKGTSGPTKIALAIKTHSTVYYSSEFALDVSYAAYSYIWAVNPNTSAAWTAAEITALQIGYESRA